MLRGEKVILRARQDADIPILNTELYDDVATRTRADPRPWRPRPSTGPASPFSAADAPEDVAPFSVVHAADGELAGSTVLWGIDTHNRLAHVGLTLRPAFRGRGLGTDVVRVLCRYGFAVLGLHRLQIETLSDNAAMIRAATRAGFQPEGTLRQTAWVDGGFADTVILGRLAPVPGAPPVTP